MLIVSRSDAVILIAANVGKKMVAHFFVSERYRSQQEESQNKCNTLIPWFKNLVHAKQLEIFLYGYNLNSVEYDTRNIPLTFAVQRYVLATKRFNE